MNTASGEREIWVQRAGAFYPLVVAAQAQTRLPLTGQLVPSEEDLARSLCWMPAVGLGLGVLWAFVAASAVEVGLSSFASAVIVVIAIVVGGGLYFERALAASSTRALERWRRAMGHVAEVDDALLSTVAVVCLAITMRTAALAQVAPGDLTSALLSAAVLSRWAISLGPLVLAFRSASHEMHELLRYLFIGVAVAVVMVLCQGASGLVLMVFSGGAMLLVARKTQSVGEMMPHAAGLALFIEVLTILAQ